jgi:hypothetical protein
MVDRLLEMGLTRGEASTPGVSGLEPDTRLFEARVTGWRRRFVELEVGTRTVKATNPDKILFPEAGYAKRDLVDYYLAVEDGIVRTLRQRPTQLRRFPDGIASEQIYQKRVPEKRPDWIEVARVGGVGEAPYPPNFPKMPGEPVARAALARAQDRTRGGEGRIEVS